jgi:hypothetical protein
MVEQNQNGRETGDDFREYLKWLHDHYEPYHARKEQVAWTAMTLYMTSVFAFMLGIATNYNDLKCLHLHWIYKLLLIVLVIITGILIGLFMKSQFAGKQVAAEIVAAVGNLMAQLVNPNFEISNDDMSSVRKKHRKNNEPYTFPNIIWEYIEKSESSELSNKQHRLRFANKYTFYVIMLIWTLAIISLICLL